MKKYEHRFKPGWFGFASKRKQATRFYQNKKYPNVLLAKTPAAGVLYPYSFMVGKWINDNDFEGWNFTKYAGINATMETDYFAIKLQKFYNERKAA